MTIPDTFPVHVSRETMALLELYAAELKKWSGSINLVSAKAADSIWSRHVLDSAQLAVHFSPNDRVWADFGSGGGLPGLVLAIIARHAFPDLQFILVEKDKRKAEFLMHIGRLTETHISVITKSIENLEPLGADVITARALAPLNDLLHLANRHLKPSGTCLFMKGRNVESELTLAMECWHMDIDSHPSLTDKSSRILEIKNIKHA